jgi:hypothetical protein
MEMLKRVKDSAAQRIEQPAIFDLPRRSTAGMKRTGVRKIITPPTQPTRAKREIQILEIHKESLVETMESLEYGPPDKIEGANYVIDLLGIAMSPILHERPGTTKEATEPKRHHTKTGWRRKSSATSRNDPVLIN